MIGGETMPDSAFDFSGLASDGAPLERYEAGERIFVRDDEGSTMYVVRSGRVRIMSFGTVLDQIGPGGIFGEMALVDGGPRSATAIADTACEVAVIDAAAFQRHVSANPELALRVMQLMAARLRRMNESM